MLHLKKFGGDPGFRKRDLWETIENSDFLESELGVQIGSEENEHDFDFDLLDSTKNDS
ncbi:catalase [Chryseobacterium indoltheticum]|uniref:catalase n=1 Tax=Chryseobacterium indoltheticum TaxID=254 RepID=A0A381FB15_9FLAO|nr:catalase [Chryseobacterium indoltheticum]SUX43776.1 Catalase HPII [Chryseobacterium indoltheticum]